MGKEVSAIELQQKFVELLNGVYHNGDQLIIKNANKPLAAIIPIEIYDRLIKQREEAFSVLDRIWEKAPKVSEEEVQTDIEQAIAEVRAKKL
ncbi:type II toxin-antitoxin system prevent-host-death family antitoxin [Candidatus Poribacteria bacterium]|nr:type II toxin-antitoxin system prevent-host-death family antitoxin [Candidatus Poribacteria bacterium]